MLHASRRSSNATSDNAFTITFFAEDLIHHYRLQSNAAGFVVNKARSVSATCWLPLVTRPSMMTPACLSCVSAQVEYPDLNAIVRTFQTAELYMGVRLRVPVSRQGALVEVISTLRLTNNKPA